MVGGVIDSALWALRQRWGELNGSGWYEIVNDTGFRYYQIAE